jgi:hypothetical protein
MDSKKYRWSSGEKKFLANDDTINQKLNIYNRWINTMVVIMTDGID